MIDSIGTLRLSLPRTANAASQRHAAVAAALSAFGLQNPAPSSRGERVVLVRELRIRVQVGASVDFTQLAAAAARNVEPAMRTALKTADRDGEVVTFGSVAEYIVEFLEHYISDRGLDVWYFGPLASCAASTLEVTLSNLAEREPGVWPDVLDQLRRRGLVVRLLQRLDPADYDLLYEPTPRTRLLSADEAKPLFAAACEIVRRATHDERAADTDELGTRLERYLQQSRAAPASWSDPSALSLVVGEMIHWLIERHGPTSVDTGAGKLVAAQFTWLDTPTLVNALTEAASRANQAAASIAAPKPLDGAPRVNRTRAVRYLAAARRYAGPQAQRNLHTGPPNDAAGMIEQIIVALRSRSDLADPAVIERLLLDEHFSPPVAPRVTAIIASLRAALRALSRTEARELVTALQDAMRTAAPAAQQTKAAGLFLLIRPLTDLRVHGSDIPGLGEAAGIEPQDPAIQVFYHDQLAQTDAIDVTATLTKNARLLGLDVERTNPCSPAAFALDLACQQLVRWLHGFDKSSVDFVLRTLIHRSGSIQVPENGPIVVHWPGSALDVLLERVGYLDPIAAVPWWPGRGLRWQR